MPVSPARTTPAALAEQILDELRARANPENVAGMARYGITTDNALGVPMRLTRALARDARKQFGRDKAAWHELAALLWSSAVHEARIMATFVDLAALVDERQMEAWALEIDSWDVCDGLCNNLFRETPFAWAKAAEWPGRTEEFVKRAGFVLGASLAVHDKTAGGRDFLPLLALALREATDERNMVKKAVNWQLRQIGKRSVSAQRRSHRDVRADSRNIPGVEVRALDRPRRAARAARRRRAGTARPTLSRQSPGSRPGSRGSCRRRASTCPPGGSR